jgi:hypothetical protein
MSSERNKLVDAIWKLLSLTQKRQLKWRNNYPQGPLPGHSLGRVDVFYETEYKGKTLRLFESKFPVERGIFSGVDWESEAVLQLVDSSGASVWTFPHSEVTEHLLSAVRYQVTEVGDFIEELLTA